MCRLDYGRTQECAPEYRREFSPYAAFCEHVRATTLQTVPVVVPRRRDAVVRQCFEQCCSGWSRAGDLDKLVRASPLSAIVAGVEECSELFLASSWTRNVRASGAQVETVVSKSHFRTIR
jgi:hypothetical protein